MKAYKVYFVLSLISLLLIGCAAPMSGAYKVMPNGETKKIDPSLIESPLTGYKLSAGDVISVRVEQEKNAIESNQYKLEKEDKLSVSFSQSASKNYKIATGDKLTLNIQGEEENLYDVLVAPDGSIVLPRLGKRIKASGTTIEQLRLRSIAAYKKLYLKPKIYWSLTDTFSEELNELSGVYNVGYQGAIVIPNLNRFDVLGKTVDAVKAQMSHMVSQKFNNDIIANVAVIKGNILEVDNIQSDRNLSVTIDTDGSLYLAGFGELQAQGKNKSELETIIRDNIQVRYQNPIYVSVGLLKYADNSVYIGGEVRRPGRYPFANNLSILRLIASAGWSQTTGDLSRVLVLRADEGNGYTIYKTNVKEILKGKGQSSQDLKMGPQDLIIVPPTGIAKGNRFVAQFIKGILPFGTNVSYNFNDDSQNNP